MVVVLAISVSGVCVTDKVSLAVLAVSDFFRKLLPIKKRMKIIARHTIAVIFFLSISYPLSYPLSLDN